MSGLKPICVNLGQFSHLDVDLVLDVDVDNLSASLRVRTVSLTRLNADCLHQKQRDCDHVQVHVHGREAA